MSFYFVFTCSFLLINFQSVILLRLNRLDNVQRGQEELYYPTYYDYENVNNVDYKAPRERYPGPNSIVGSQFPSLIRPEKQGVSVEGPNRFTKYKNYRPLLRNEDIQKANLIKSLSQSRKFVNENYRNSIKDEVDNPNKLEIEREAEMEFLLAMKKAHELHRKNLNEGVLEASMQDHPKTRRTLEASRQPSALKHTSNEFYSQPYHQTINSNFKKVSFLSSISDFYFIVIVACVSSIAIFSVMGAGYCFYKVQQQNKAASEVEFPAYGIVGPACRPGSTTPPKDRKLTQNAQMYHYQHQKQQMISNEKNSSIPKHQIGSDIESEEENEDGEYTVYECPGLAPTGEMEIKNPLFQDDLTPMDSPAGNKINSSKDTKSP